MKYTLIWVDSWMQGSHRLQITRKTWVVADSVEAVMQEYGDYLIYLFEGHLLQLGEEMRPEEVVIIKD